MIHSLKLNIKYCDDVLYRRKLFEVRLNDRNYTVGDKIRFVPVDDNGNLVNHEIQKIPFYKIIYILDNFCGLKENYIAFTIAEIRKTQER